MIRRRLLRIAADAMLGAGTVAIIAVLGCAAIHAKLKGWSS